MALSRVSTGELFHVPEGDNVIGRGPLLKVKNQHVSRNHALLRLKSGSFSICPKHPSNPCFLKAVGESTFTSLAKDQWQDLSNGDCFALLPGGEVVFRIDADPATLQEAAAPATESVDDLLFGDEANANDGVTKSAAEEAENECEEDGEKEAIENSEQQPALKAGGTENQCEEGGEREAIESTEQQPALEGDSIRSKSKDDGKSKAIEGTRQAVQAKAGGSTNKPRVLPDWLSGLAPPPPSSAASSAVKRKRAPTTATKRAPSTATKRAPSTATKHLSPASDDEPPPAKRPAAKGGQKTKSEDPDDIISEAKPSKSPVEPEDDRLSEGQAGKKLCPYGTRCYRKNPGHFREYSHDFAAADSDTGGSDEDNSMADKAVCPYGAECYRKNPAHLRLYTHPAKGTRQSARVTRGRKKKAGDGEEEDSEQPNTYDYNDSFIDDDGGTPSSACPSEDSDYTPPEQEGGNKEEDEDVGELVADAEEFMSNKKMRR